MNRGVRMRKFPRALTNPCITYYNRELCRAWSLGIGYPASERRATNSLRYAIIIGDIKATAETMRAAVYDSLTHITPLEILAAIISGLKKERF